MNGEIDIEENMGKTMVIIVGGKEGKYKWRKFDLKENVKMWVKIEY
jgi:hypothetical protein